jgi:hypothetical protein
MTATTSTRFLAHAAACIRCSALVALNLVWAKGHGAFITGKRRNGHPARQTSEESRRSGAYIIEAEARLPAHGARGNQLHIILPRELLLCLQRSRRPLDNERLRKYCDS